MKWQDLQNLVENKKTDQKSTTTALVLGIAGGIVAGILFAPKSGRETRNQLIKKVKDTLDEGKDTASSAKDKASQAADDASHALQEGKNAAKDTLDTSHRRNEREV